MASFPLKNMACWNKDVVTEIALHLSVQSLFRCRAVCKLWRDVIDSPSLRKLHTLTNYEEEDDDYNTVYLQLNYVVYANFVDVKVSTKMIVNGKSLTLNLGFNESFPSPRFMTRWDISKFTRAVNGLICFNLSVRPFAQPLAICNPFLGQFKILPFSPIPASCEILSRDVGIGGDDEFYKVVEVVYCDRHRLSHAHLYSRRSDSWRDLGDLDREMCILDSINSSCNDGRFAHWYASGGVILTFDMRNEVFRTIKMPGFRDILLDATRCRIVGKDDGCSFVLVALPDGSNELARIYESSLSICGITRKLSWNHVANLELEQPLLLPTPACLPLWRRDCVIVKIGNNVDWVRKLFLYDCCARRFVGCFELPDYWDLFDYRGTFVSP